MAWRLQEVKAPGWCQRAAINQERNRLQSQNSDWAEANDRGIGLRGTTRTQMDFF